ncbi:hypothetical protein PC123_g8720 [Phytophthora cactorum]|nr:hypothetical protein PC123_g8720 [Phytophthora cactorum]
MSEDEATSTRAHLSGDDYRIVSWMEDKKNFDAINGYKGKTSALSLPISVSSSSSSNAATAVISAISRSKS